VAVAVVETAVAVVLVVPAVAVHLQAQLADLAALQVKVMVVETETVRMQPVVEVVPLQVEEQVEVALVGHLP
jgi:hypothetical protein